MKTTSLTYNQIISGAVCAGAVLLTAAVASGQNLYTSGGGTSDGSIYQITPAGIQTVIATGMDYPDGLTFNSAGDLFVANNDLNSGTGGNITEVKPGGATSVFASGLDPIQMAFNSSGNLFEADYQSGNINEFTPGGTKSLFASGFADPISLAFNNAGDLFVGAGYGTGAGYITEITPGGVQSSFATGLTFPVGLAFNSAGDLFTCENDTGIIYEYTPGGVRSTFATLSQTDLDGMAFNSAGNLFVTTGRGSSIIEIAPNGTQSSFVSGLSYSPGGLTFAPVPEPSTLALLAVGASAVALRLRRKK